MTSRTQATQTTTTVWFKGQKHPCSNLYPYPIAVFGGHFPSAEHAYQYRKALFMRCFQAAPFILSAPNAYVAMKIGQTIPVNDDWHSVKRHVMSMVLRAKIDQCDPYRNYLASLPPNVDLREKTKHRFWGGLYGQNVLGQLHVSNRENLWVFHHQ